MKHKHADLIHAWADGAQIQYKNSIDNNWNDVEYPSWHPSTGEYRIKPEPKSDVIYRTRVKKWEISFSGIITSDNEAPNVAFTFDGETGELKSAEVLK